MNADNTDLNSLSENVLGAVFEVSNTLGAGFLEKVYQRALLRELSLRGIRATAEACFAVTYKGHWENTLPICLSRTCWWWCSNVPNASPTNTWRNVLTICEPPA